MQVTISTIQLQALIIAEHKKVNNFYNAFSEIGFEGESNISPGHNVQDIVFDLIMPDDINYPDIEMPQDLIDMGVSKEEWLDGRGNNPSLRSSWEESLIYVIYDTEEDSDPNRVSKFLDGCISNVNRLRMEQV